MQCNCTCVRVCVHTLIFAISAWSTAEITTALWETTTGTTTATAANTTITTLPWLLVIIIVFAAGIAITFGGIAAGFAALRTPMLLE